MTANFFKWVSILFVTSSALAATAAPANWVTSWTASAQGPYPVGSATAQPNLSLVFPVAQASDQSFRMVVKPTIWGKQVRVRLSNVHGTQSVTFDDAYVGLQWSGSAIVAGTNRPLTFAGKPAVTVAPGAFAWSDATALDFATQGKYLAGRKLSVSFHVAGTSGPMTWHAKALQSSYLTRPGAGSKGSSENESAFPFATSSWYFIDALDMDAPQDAAAIVAFGDSITDGTASTLNADDRWPDVLGRRIALVAKNDVAVLNAGIGSNQVIGPATYSPLKPYQGGPAATQRLVNDVLSLSGVRAMIWLEGINDFSKNGNAEAADVIDGMRQVIAHIRKVRPDIKIVGATVTSALGSTSAAHGFELQDQKRKQLNEFIRHGGAFDSVVDFDSAALDPATGGLKPEFVPDNTVGGPGDKLHPNRLGYQTLGATFDLSVFDFIRR